MKNNLYGRNFIKKEWSGDFRWIYKERAELAPNHSLKWLSEAKQKARSEASRQKSKIEIFWREALLRAFSFTSLSHF